MSSHSFAPGECVSDYEVLDILGEGGFGQVYKVRNLISGRVEAMKILLPMHSGDPHLVDRFMREIRVQATLQHPNIASFLGAQNKDGQILMCIEFVEGVTLGKAMSKSRLDRDLACDWIGQTLDALGYAHSRGVVHRDIKPDNIMIRDDGWVKLMDFGIARMAQDRKLTATGVAIGSAHYMSPEQITAVPDIDGRTDLYSLGIVLYEAVTGKLPFDGPSHYSVVAAHLHQQPKPPVQLDSSVSPALNDAILRALAKDRAQRYQTAEQFRYALDLARGVRPHPTPAPPPVRTTPVQPPVHIPTPVPHSPQPPVSVLPAPHTPQQQFYPPQQPPPAVPRAGGHLKSPTVAAVLGLMMPLFGALYLGKSNMVVRLLLAELAVLFIAVAMDGSQAAGTVSDWAALAGLFFHGWGAWRCAQWARELNLHALNSRFAPPYPR